MVDNYPDLLRPNSSESIAFEGDNISIPKISRRYRAWTGDPHEYDMRKGQAINFDGQPKFAELVTVKLAELSGWDARWVQTYGTPQADPHLLIDWQNDRVSNQQHAPIADAYVRNQLNNIVQENGGYSGCWDVVLWRQQTILFIECKRSRQDRMKANQIGWIHSAFRVGFHPEQFIVKEWTFLGD